MISFTEWLENRGEVILEGKKHRSDDKKEEGRDIHHKLENKVHDLIKDKACLEKAAPSTLENLAYWLEKTLDKMDDDGILTNKDLEAFTKHVKRAKHDADTIKTTVRSHEHTELKHKVMKLLKRMAK
jgi:hypothetical protein